MQPRIFIILSTIVDFTENLKKELYTMSENGLNG